MWRNNVIMIYSLLVYVMLEKFKYAYKEFFVIYIIGHFLSQSAPKPHKGI